MKIIREAINPFDSHAAPAYYVNFLGHEMWFRGQSIRKQLRCMRLASRLYRKAEQAKNQLMELQKLVDAISKDY